MSNDWWEMLLRIPGSGIDLVCSELMDLGCTGVTVEERRLDTFTLPDPNEPVQGSIQIRAYFAVSLEMLEPLREAIQARLKFLAPLVSGLNPQLPEVVSVRQEDWAEGWKQHFPAVRIGQRLVICPSWEEFHPNHDDIIVTLDPGMAFGTGTHGTTRLCLEVIAELCAAPVPPRRVLDVGTGSGILAIAAAALGASRVLACDIDADACRTARENIQNNGLSAAIEVTPRRLEELEGGFDLVLANILAEENIRLAPDLVSRMAPGGSLVLSGILQEKEALVATAFRPFPLTGPLISHREEWSCLVYRRGS